MSYCRWKLKVCEFTHFDFLGGEGGLLSTTCPGGQGVCQCPCLSTQGGEGVKIGQN